MSHFDYYNSNYGLTEFNGSFYLNSIDDGKVKSQDIVPFRIVPSDGTISFKHPLASDDYIKVSPSNLTPDISVGDLIETFFEYLLDYLSGDAVDVQIHHPHEERDDSSYIRWEMVQNNITPKGYHTFELWVRSDGTFELVNHVKLDKCEVGQSVSDISPDTTIRQLLDKCIAFFDTVE